LKEEIQPVPCAVVMTQEQNLLRRPRGPEGGTATTKGLIEGQIGTVVDYRAEVDLESSAVTSTVTSTAATPRPGQSASPSPGSDFQVEIFGVDEQRSVETSGLQSLFKTLDHDELGNITISMDETELNTPTVEFAPSEEEIFPDMKEIEEINNSNNINNIWTTATDIETLSCANPLDIEGRDILDAPIYFADQEPNTSVIITIPEIETTTISIPEIETTTISIPEMETTSILFPEEATLQRPRKKKLRLIMPKPEPMVTSPSHLATSTGHMVTSAVPTTPDVIESIERSLQKNSDESIDLLAYVTDSTIKVDDPAFLAFIGSTTPGATDEVSNQPPKGKKLFAKRSATAAKAKATAETINGHAFVPAPLLGFDNHSLNVPRPSTSSSSTGDRVAKYRRMRDLNNEASKRCRQNRKRKQSGLAGEEEALQKRNQVLKAKCLKMEGLVERMKKQFLKRVAKPQTPLDLDKIMADRLAKF